MSEYNFMALSNMTREVIKSAKLGDALYTVLDISGNICDSCNQIEKTFAIKKVYVGRIDEGIDGDRRLSLYRESPKKLKNSRYGLSAEFRPVATAYYGTDQYLSLNKDNLLPELEHRLRSKRELDEFCVKSDTES